MADLDAALRAWFAQHREPQDERPAVLDLHAPVDDGSGIAFICRTCSKRDMGWEWYGEPDPCPTKRAIAKALGIEMPMATDPYTQRQAELAAAIADWQATQDRLGGNAPALAVLDLNQPRSQPELIVCGYCYTGQGVNEGWPCGIYEAIRDAACAPGWRYRGQPAHAAQVLDLPAQGARHHRLPARRGRLAARRESNPRRRQRPRRPRPAVHTMSSRRDQG